MPTRDSRNRDDLKTLRASTGSNFILRKGGILALSLIVVLAIIYSPGFANPQDGQVTAGQATISSPNSSTVQVNQSSDKAVIDWRSFNIQQHETTQFQQPNSSSITLNRVDPHQGASNIFGTLTANGQIWLINPAGILFGSTARVDVGGLLATTANITNADFMSGNYHFVQSPDWNGGIVNEGLITAKEGGMVALVAPGVENSGIIKANYGKVALGAGTEFTVDFYGDELINFGVNGAVKTPAIDPRTGEPMRDGVKNSGKIIARGGTVLMTAKTAGAVLDNSINMTGYVVATSASEHNGVIVLSGGSNGTVRVTGKLIASGKRAGQTGGTVKILGSKVIVTDHARINVSGYAGGGQVLIGGNAHGAGPEYNSDYAYVGPNVKINASALMNGDGGKVVVWSNIATDFYGLIEAEGGLYSGNGGWVETSGAYLDVTGLVDALAKTGKIGTWLLDPTNIWIASSLGSAQIAGMPGSDTSADTSSNPFAASGAVSDSFLGTGTIQTALGGADVTVTTTNASGTGSGNITVVDTISWTSTHNLTLTAANNIAINAIITDTVAGTLKLNATGNVTQTAAIGGALLLTQQGAGTVTLSQNNTYTGLTTVSSGTVSVTNAGGLGTTAAGTTVTSGAVLNINGAAVGAEPVTINGTGVGSTGALTGTGTSSLSGAVTLGTTGTSIGANSGASFTLSGGITGATLGLVLTGTGNGTESGVIGTTTGTVAMNGSGTWTLSNAKFLLILPVDPPV